MKKITIILFLMWCIVFGVVCYHESQIDYYDACNRGFVILTSDTHAVNKIISKYEGRKIRGSEFKILISLVEILNAQKKYFPIAIRYADVLPGSHDWAAPTTQNLNSGDTIRDSAYYEVVMQDQLPENNVDGYLDTITIRPYSFVVITNSPSLSGE